MQEDLKNMNCITFEQSVPLAFEIMAMSLGSAVTTSIISFNLI